MQKITPFLWFDGNAEEAVNFYTSVFKDSKIGSMARYPEGSPGPAGQLMTANFTINGQDFIALNGGPIFKFTEAVSFVVNCETQEEIDYYWNKLTSNGGEESMCGWLKDKFGLSWQIVPTAIGRLMGGGNAEQSQNVMHALLKMKKLNIKELEDAFNK
jgi:predicted 3-demethylubiquinone-9 3-methyltransferase (glyoxalase superfamily)